MIIIYIKKFLAFLLSHFLYHIGDFISYFITTDNMTYDMYNWCMTTSADIQEWAGNNTPWGKPN